MSNPWDPPPQPLQGDKDDAVLLEWVGRVISEWEHIERQLSLLYAIIAGNPDGNAEIQEYYVGTIFK